MKLSISWSYAQTSYKQQPYNRKKMVLSYAQTSYQKQQQMSNRKQLNL